MRDAILSLLPPGTSLAIWSGDAEPAEYPEETTSIARAVPSRVAEFRRGRACARAALAELGAGPVALPAAASRAPVWPAGYVGSITHCRGFVAAAAARADRVAGLGIDAEPVGPLPDGTHARIVHPLDRGTEQGRLDKVVFSAKEAIFKALSPPTDTALDFLDVVLELDPGGAFRAAHAPDARVRPSGLEALRGGWVVRDGLVVTAAWLERAAADPVSPAP